jgi:Flp pilus assembly pilin Flp
VRSALDRRYLIGGSGIKGQEFPSLAQPAQVRARRWTLHRLWRDERGTTAIEFAFVGLATIYFIVGIIEFAMAMTVGNSLEAATNLSSRLGKTGFVEEHETQEETIRGEIKRRVGPLIDMSKLTIGNEVYNDFESLTTPDIFTDTNGDGDTLDAGEWTDVDHDGFKDGTSGVGSAGNIVVYKISYPWHVMTPLIGNVIGNDGVINLMAYSVVKNEPY